MKILQGRLNRTWGELPIALRPSFLPGKPNSAQAGLTPAEQAGPFKRLLHFPARALTEAALTAEQEHRAAHLARLGQLYSPGIVRGLEASLALTPTTQEKPDWQQLQISVTPGLGICRSGEEIALETALYIPDLRSLPVLVTSTLRRALFPNIPTATGVNLEQAGGSYDATYVSSLAELLAAEKAHGLSSGDAYYPLWFVLLLQPIEVEQDRSFDPANRAEQDPDLDAFRDVVRIDGCRPVLFHYDEAGLFHSSPLSGFPAERASAIWAAECVRNHYEPETTLEKIWPWEHCGLALGLICLDDQDFGRGGPATAPRLPNIVWPALLPAAQPIPEHSYIDRSAVVRTGGKQREHTPLPADQLRNSKTLRHVGTHLVSPELSRALLDGLTEQLSQAAQEPRFRIQLPADELVYVDLPKSTQPATWCIQLLEQDLGELPTPGAKLSVVPDYPNQSVSVEQNLKKWAVDLPLLSGAWAVQVEVPAGELRGIWLHHTDGKRTHIAIVFQPVNVGGTLCGLPAAGLLPAWAVDVAGTQTKEQAGTRVRFRMLRNRFFPTNYDIDVLPIREEELATLLDRCAPLAPYDLASAQEDAVRVLVPVPADRFDANLLQLSTVSPEFAEQQKSLEAQQATLLGQYAQQHSRYARLHCAITGQRITEAALPDESSPAASPSLTTELTEVGRLSGDSPAWSPDSSRVALIEGGRNLVVLSANDGSVLAKSRVSKERPAVSVRNVVFGPNSDIILVHTNCDISIWQAATCQQRASIETTTNIDKATLSHDGQYVLYCDSQLFKVTARTWAQEGNANISMTFQLSSRAIGVVMPSDTRVLCVEEQRISLWNPADPAKELKEAKPLSPYAGCALGPNGSSLIVWTAQNVFVHDLRAEFDTLIPSQEFELPMGSRGIRDVAISPIDGSVWVAAQSGLFRGLPASKSLSWLSDPKEGLAVTAVQFAAQGHLAAVRYEKTLGLSNGMTAKESSIRLWSTENPQVVATLPGPTGWAALSPDGVSLIVPSLSGGLRLLDIQTDLTALTKILRNSVLSLEQQGLLDDMGVESFIKFLRDIVDEANAQIDLGFLSLQTDIFRLRQHMLQSAATNLASSPVIAQIAETQSNLTASEELGQYYKTLLDKPVK